MLKAKAAVLRNLGDWTYDEIEIPNPTSKTYSLSIISSTYGFAFGNKKSVITYASNHFEADNKLKTKPFL